MRARPFIWILLCLLCLAGAWLFWHQPANTRTKPSALPKAAAPVGTATASASTAPKNLTAVSTNNVNNVISVKTNQFAWRLSNTTKSLDQLMRDRHAILLENALIDSSRPLNLSIPKNLQSQGDPGAYIVQARGPIDNGTVGRGDCFLHSERRLSGARSGGRGQWVDGKSAHAGCGALRAVLQNILVHARDGWTKNAFFRANENQPGGGAFVARAGGETVAAARGNLFDAWFVQKRRGGDGRAD
jgi:hypothetical protein